MARIKHGTLVADTVATVSLTGSHSAIEIMNVNGAAAIYFRTDGEDPEVAGDDCEVIPAAMGAAMAVDPGDTASVKMISAGTPMYCVRGS